MIRTLNAIILLVFFTVNFTLLFSGTSHAYLDPGTSTYVIQIIAGAFISAGAAIGIYRHKIMMFIKKKQKNK